MLLTVYYILLQKSVFKFWQHAQHGAPLRPGGRRAGDGAEGWRDPQHGRAEVPFDIGLTPCVESTWVQLLESKVVSKF